MEQKGGEIAMSPTSVLHLGPTTTLTQLFSMMYGGKVRLETFIDVITRLAAHKILVKEALEEIAS